MLRLGVLGFSEGNGHPFSFSSILNGFSVEALRTAGWGGIADYLRARDASEIGTLDARVTHVWTQDADLSKAIAAASRIDNVVQSPLEMLSAVDGVMILRDDPESHYALAMPFVEAGLPVFIDKPLTLEAGPLSRLGEAVAAGKVFSVAGLRFARELDAARTAISDGYRPTLVRATVVNDWARYGVHMIDAVFGLTSARPTAVTSLTAQHEAFAIEMDDGTLFEVACLGSVPKVFRIDLFGVEGHSSFDLFDNFSAFRRTLARFIEMVKSGTPPIPAADTLASMRTLMAGALSLKEHRRVDLTEVES